MARTLRLAVERGYSDAQQFKGDEELKSLRNRKDFQELIASMEKKAGKRK